MNQTAQSERAVPPTLHTPEVEDAALFGHRDDFVIDLRQAGKTRSYLRGHETIVSNKARKPGQLRRAFDVAAASLGILFTSPLLVAIGIAARVGSPGPSFFVQERVGQDGKIFRCYKFRSMHTDADERLAELLRTDDHFRAKWLADQKVAQDPRTTTAGRFLRKTSLDELPQLINVLKGDMSLVGPRPVVPEETVRYGDAMPTVLTVRPGITGLWQVSGRNNLPYPERVQLDLRYVDEQSLVLDAKILVLTLVAVTTGQGAQ